MSASGRIVLISARGGARGEVIVSTISVLLESYVNRVNRVAIEKSDDCIVYSNEGLKTEGVCKENKCRGYLSKKKCDENDCLFINDLCV
mmetsp:Transcript_35223/g.35741  ORF Transcript_35223/g.35741 Transcript_35223/m.35741 type:complete len:89 (+) Transcript_35223:657-923(+)